MVAMFSASSPPFFLPEESQEWNQHVGLNSSRSSPSRDVDGVIPPVQRLWLAFLGEDTLLL